VQVRGMVFWLAGDLGWALEPRASIAAAVLAVLVAVAIARPLNVLAAGELRARAVGLELETWRLLLFVVCAALTAIAVVSAGTVGFVGLITPHAVRLGFKTSDHRIVAPAAALAGGTVPVGAIMALIGAPIFLFLLRARNPNTH
jgi:iron complex transport system permease protein